MNEYVATFFSHYGALTYCKALKEQSIDAKLMPAPRRVSSSCGTCVCYVHASYIDLEDFELDGIFIKRNNVFECVFKKD